MKKKIVSVLLAASMVLSLTACGGSGNAGAGAASTEAGSEAAATASVTNTASNVLAINLASEPDYLDPTLSSSSDGGSLAENSFAGLYRYNQQEELVPAIASEMPEVSDDGITYTVKLKETKWSDGSDLTANDFIYSWNRAVDEKTAADYGYLFDVIKHKDDGTLELEATDDYTLVITLAAPCPYFTSLMAFPTFFPVPQAAVEAADPDGTNPGAWAQEAGFVSNGAYTLSEWKHNESMIYVKNPNYYDAENVTMDELHFMLSADDTAIYAAYNSGDLDFADVVPNDEVPTLKSNPEFHIIDNLGTYYLAFNVGADLFKDKTPEQAADIRHAIALLIDRRYIVDTVGQCDQVPADSYIPVGMADGNGGIFKTDKVSYYDAESTDVETAKSLLEGAGYSFTDNGDGTYAISPALSLPYIINENTLHQGVAECIQQDLAVLGIEMNIQTEDWNVFLEDRKKGNYTFAREGWLADFDDPINMLEMFASNSGNDDPQLGKCDSPAAPAWDEYDKLISDIKSTTDFAKRVDMMHEAEDMLMNSWAVIPVYYYNDLYVQKGNVEGVYSTIFGHKFFMYATKK